MSEYRGILTQLGLRALMAAPFLIVGLSGVSGLASPFVILAGAIVLAHPIARLLAEPWGTLFYPGARYDRPQPIYSIPKARRKEGRYEEAMAGFAAIARDDPRQWRAYAEMIDIAFVDLKDPGRAGTILRAGLAALTDADDRASLEASFENSRSMQVSGRDGVPDRPPIRIRPSFRRR